MAKLSASQRAKLPDRAFAHVDARGKRSLPIHDEAHVRNALSRFNQVRFEDEAAKERARKRLLNAAKKFGIVPVGFITGQLESEARKTEQIRHDLKEAQKIQRGLLPSHDAEVEGFSMTGICRPCRAVGGDWYDYIPLGDGRLAIAVADVSGKGIGAALLMSSARSVLRIVAAQGAAPAEVLRAVNKTLAADLPASKFVTMIYAILDPSEGSVVFANAGHLPPILVDDSGVQTLRAKPQLPLGVKGGAYKDHYVEMSAGSRLILYSDGVVEARNKASEEYGEERLLDAASKPDVSAQGLVKDVRSFMKNRAAADDITVVVVKR